MLPGPALTERIRRVPFHRLRPAGLAALSAGLALAMALTAVPAARAQDRTQDLRKIERALTDAERQEQKLRRAAEALARELDELRRQSVEAARSVRERETALTRLENRLDGLRQARAARRAELAGSRARLDALLAALSHVPPDPRRFFTLFPGPPVEAARSAMLMQAAAPELARRAAALGDELVELARLESRIRAQMTALASASASLSQDRDRLAALVASRSRAYGKADRMWRDSRQRTAKLAEQASDLRELVERLRRAPPEPAPADGPEAAALSGAPPGLRAFPASGQITAPVAGRLLRRYGENLGFGKTARGVTIRTRAAARVVAPYDGQVIFAGPFRTHGLILIIAHRGGYHSVLSGLAQIDTEAGQWVLAGEPVGIMAAGENAAPDLYIELRRAGRPVNPLNWLPPDRIGQTG